MEAMLAPGGRLVHYTYDPGPSEARGALPALVFINSLGTDLRLWDSALDYVQGGFRVLRFDKRGHGLSDAAPGDLFEQAEDVLRLMERLQIGRAAIVGISVGGLIAQAFAARWPERVTGLMLCDTAYRIGPPEIWDARIKAVREGGLEAIADAVMQRWFPEDFRSRAPERLALARNMFLRCDPQGYMHMCAALRAGDLEAEARRIKAPTLCVVGEQDLATPPALTRALSEAIAGAEFQIIPGAGHLPCYDRPAAFAALLEGFMTRIGHV